jgi:flagellar basal-body rod protein FlgB
MAYSLLNPVKKSGQVQMIIEQMFSKTKVPFLKTTLNAYSTRHKAIANNIANVETRDYRPLKVEFESQLQRALDKKRPVGQRTDARHLAIGGNDMSNMKETVSRSDQAVNIEDEMGELAKNQLRFEFAARKLRGMYDQMKSAISGHVR